MDPFNGTQDPHAYLQAFRAQVYIRGGSDAINYKLFLGTLRGITLQWFSSLPASTIHMLEVTNHFDIIQTRGETLKQYLVHFNSTMVQVNDPNQEFFMKTFQKGLCASQFSDLLVLRRPTNMEESKARAKKHIEAD
ncbi:hypothetical protein CR513_55900, partial [Mucuna pruriens]